MPIIFISGALKGLGWMLARTYARAGWVVFGGVLYPDEVKPIPGVTYIKHDQGTLTDSLEVMAHLKNEYGVEKLDVVIANAGVLISEASFRDAEPEAMDITWRINVRGPLLLFQAAHPLLHKDSKFVVISSSRGRLGQHHYEGQALYAQSKAAVTFMAAKLHYEEPDLITLAIHPGLLKTEMGDKATRFHGPDDPAHSTEDVAPKILKLIEGAKKDTISGQLVDYEGNVLSW
ncbi:hypothetical protein EHS25_008488 [Saitozyma podzolica]|uniref:NAD(P)-binding protein n=1 Tax=Saitozyma podzolica TaxID=1890683 RepID=A0A427YLX3_9TREE|nr:hypothetical protein EHS25_008488 [Saitozyma podzolica]